MDKIKKYRREIAVGGSWYPQKEKDGKEVYVKTTEEYASVLNENSVFTKIRYVLHQEDVKPHKEEAVFNIATANKEGLLKKCATLDIETSGDETNTELRMKIKDKQLELK